MFEKKVLFYFPLWNLKVKFWDTSTTPFSSDILTNE